MLRTLARASIIVIVLSIAIAFITLAVRDLSRPTLCDSCNVVVIALETVSDDALPGGFPLLTKRAEDGIRFTNAYSSAKWTYPGMVALMTGAYPWEIGIYDQKYRMPPVPTIAETMAGYGYETAAFVEGPYTDTVWGVDRGFITWNATDLPMTENASERFASALAWVQERKKDSPYFLYVQPHDFYDLFDHEGFAALEASLTDTAPSSAVEKAYIAKLHAVDAELDAFIKKIISQDRNTVIIVTSLYGADFIGDARVVGGATLPSNRMLNVPLVVFIPDAEARRIDASVETRSLFPTISAIVGAPEPDDASLTPYLQGRAREDRFALAYIPWTPTVTQLPSPDALYADLPRQRAAVQRVEFIDASELPGDTVRSLIRGPLHVLEFPDGTQRAYNLITDPREERDLLPRLETLPAAERRALTLLLLEFSNEL